MLADVLALIVFCACALTGVVLLWRRLPPADVAAAGQTVCLNCKAPTSKLSPDSFICPGCGQDVRHTGVGPRPSKPFRGPLWRVLNLSVGVCFLTLIGAAIALTALPRVHYVSSEVSLRVSGPDDQRVELTVHGRTRPDARPAPVEGQLHADLLLATGDVFSLEVESPSLRYRATDSNQREVIPMSAPGALDEPAVLRWMESAGLDTTRHNVRFLARETFRRIREMLSLPETPLSPLPPSSSLGGSVSGGASYSGSTAPPQSATAVALIVGSIVWLTGLVWILRPTLPSRGQVPSIQEGPA
jgi:hypothetical protein